MLSASDMALRKGRITGSTLAMALGISKFGGPIDAWEIICKGEEKVDPNSEHIRRGRFLEDPIRAWAALKYGLSLVGPVGDNGVSTVVHPVHKWLAATSDGYVLEQGRRVEPIEIKSPGAGFDWGKDGTSDIPEYYLPQCALQMACNAMSTIRVFALIGGQLRMYRLHRHEELERFVISASKDFYYRYIVTGVPPPIDGSKSYTKHLQSIYPDIKQDVLLADDKQKELLRQYMAARDAAKAAEEHRQLIENQLLESIGDAKGVESDIARVLWSRVSEQRRVNWREVAGKFKPEETLISQHTKVSPPYRRIFVKDKRV